MKISDLYESSHEIPDGFEWIKKNCSEAIQRMTEHDVFMYKGISASYNAPTLLKPNETPRKPANAKTTWYTEIINNGENGFSGFPKREFIFTTSDDTANNYGNTHYVIPVDGAIIGICPEADIWMSFKDILDYDAFEYGFVRVINKYTDKKRGHITISDLREFHKKLISKEIEVDEEDIDNYFSKDSRLLMKELLDTTNTVAALAQFIFNDGSFTKQPINEITLPTESRELWTDSPVVLLSTKYLPKEKLINLLK